MMQKRIFDFGLTLKDQLYYDGDVLFTGIMFFEEKKYFYTAYHVNAGVKGEKYRPVCLAEEIDDDLPMVDPGVVVFHGEQAKLNGELFNGVIVHGYFSEAYYEDGIEDTYINFGKNQSVESFNLDHGGIYERGKINEGKLTEYWFDDYFFIRFNPENKLGRLRIEKDFSILGQEKLELFKFLPVQYLSDLLNWDFSEQLNLAGDYIDDDYVSKLVHLSKLTQVQKIDFYETNVIDFNFLSELYELRSIHITVKRKYSPTVEEKILQDELNESIEKCLLNVKAIFKEERNSDVKIILNQSELTL